MDETNEVGTVTVGQRLRAAREAKGLSLEDLAAQTRIPRRHLESLEESDWERLPAPTYTMGFAKSYASAVGIDRAEIGQQLRDELGGTRMTTTTTEVFEPADPARTMPKWLVLGALAAVIAIVLLLSWLNERSLEQPAATSAANGSVAATGPAPAPAAPSPAAHGPVVLTAAAPAWIQVTDQGRTLFEGELAAGQIYQVPETATAPLLRAGKPEALRVTVGGALAPPVGPPGRVASNVSLKAADLMQSRAAPAPILPAPSAPPGVRNSAG